MRRIVGLCGLLVMLVACSPQEAPVPVAREVAPADTAVRRPHRLLFPSAVRDSLSAGRPVVEIPTDSFSHVPALRSGNAMSAEPPFWSLLSGPRPRYLTSKYQGTTTLVRDLVGNRLIAWDDAAQKPAHVWETGMRPGEFRSIVDVVTNDSLIAVSDFRNNRIQVFGPDYQIVRVLPLHGRSGVGSMALTGAALYSLAETASDSTLAWRFVRQDFDWSLQDTMPGFAFASPYHSRGLRIWPRIAASRDFMVCYQASVPYVMVFDADGRRLGMVAFAGGQVETGMAAYRKSQRESTPLTLADGTQVSQVVYPFFISGISVSPDGWLTITEENRAVTRVDLHTLASPSPVWTRVRL